MAKKKAGSTVAPKERINITYKPAVGGAKENIELPFKVSVLGDFSQQPDERAVENREPVNVNANNFDGVMAEQGLKLQFSVPNRMVEGASDELDVDIDVKGLKDLTPDNLLQSVPALQDVFRIREALQALKGPLGNSPQMRKLIQGMLSDGSQRQALMDELGLK